MHSKIIAFLLPSLALALALPQSPTTTAVATPSQTPYYGVSLAVVVTPGLTTPKEFEPWPAEINVLGQCVGTDDECSISEIIIQPGTASNVDENSINCRAYKDLAGVIPGSAMFNLTTPALITTNLAVIRSILCYIVEV